MKKVLIAYFSLTGTTQKMAEYISEGVRMSGQEVTVKRISEIKASDDISGYDGYIFGCPTYHRDMTEPMKTFLFLARKCALEGKPAGAFGSYTHDGNAPELVFNTMQYVFKMEPFELGPFNLLEAKVDTSEGMHACQDYGKVFGETVEKT
jgi:flavodoxin